MKTIKIAALAMMVMSLGVTAQENFSGINLSGNNPISSVNGFYNKIEFTGRAHGALVFNPGKTDELMFGMHTNGNFYWGTGRSSNTPNFYSMVLNGKNGDLHLKRNLNVVNSISSKQIKMNNGNTDLMLYRDGDVGDWSLLRTNKGNGIGLIGQPDRVALAVSRLNSYVGIGTLDPKEKLDVIGNIKVTGNLNTSSSVVSKMIRMDNGNTDLFMYRDGDVGDWSLLRTNKGNGIGLIGKPDQVALSVSRLTGNIGIRTTDTKGFELGVNGKIAANEVKVAIYPNWPDFVFEKTYNLPTLLDVENHIKEKGHLKDIPSAEEVEKNGFFLGEMDAKLLQKIEELTLYTIEQEKEIKELKKAKSEIAKQQKEINTQKKEIEELKKQNSRIKDLEILVEKLIKDKN